MPSLPHDSREQDEGKMESERRRGGENEREGHPLSQIPGPTLLKSRKPLRFLGTQLRSLWVDFDCSHQRGFRLGFPWAPAGGYASGRQKSKKK